MPKVDLAGAVETLRSANSILITTHANPDGDAIGSLIALAFLLEGMGKDEVTCAMHDPVPRVYHWLPGAERVAGREGIGRPFDLAVTVDVGRTERIGSMAELFTPDQKHLVIDHHADEGAPDAVTLIDPSYAAAGEMVADLFAQARVELTPEAAECIYVAMATDTGGFRFSNTSARTHRTAARLIEAGVDVSAVSGRVFDTLSIPKFKLLCRVLERMVLSEKGTYAYSSLTERDMIQANATAEDLEGLVNFGRNIEGVHVGFLFREMKTGVVKVSLRSRPGFDSAKALHVFGGGGHAGAAGAVLDMDMEQARDAVLKVVRQGLGEDS